MKTINEDELVGYIMRKTADKSLCYGEVRAVLDAELDFLESKGIAGESEAVEEYAEPIKPLEVTEERAGDKVTIK